MNHRIFTDQTFLEFLFWEAASTSQSIQNTIVKIVWVTLLLHYQLCFKFPLECW